MSETELVHRFTYHAPKPGQPVIYEDIRSACLAVAMMIDGHMADSREKSIAMTKLEEVVFWSNASVARNE